MKKEIFKTLIFFILSVQSAWACKLSKDSEWFLTDEKIIASTPEILIAKLKGVKENFLFGEKMYKLEMEIIQVLRGKSRKDEVFFIEGIRKSYTNINSYSKDCKMILSFEKNRMYIVLKDKFHPRAFIEYQDGTSSWFKKIKDQAFESSKKRE